MDVVELDAASNNRVDDMRELVPRVYTAAADLRRKVFIIDEVQRIKEGWDVLLKTLEEPPDGVVFVFCTTDPSQIRPAVVSRLQRFTFRPLTQRGDRGQARAHPRGGGPGRRAGGHRRSSRGSQPAACAMPSRCSTRSSRPRTPSSTPTGCATCWASPRRPPSIASWMRSRGGDVLAGIDVLDALEAEGRDLVAFRSRS